MPGPVDHALLEEVAEILRAAGEITLRWFRSDELAVERKEDGTPVTQADKETERFLREQIEMRWPGDGIKGEEEAEKAGTSGRRWILDPIDGTKAFHHGVPLYCNLLALHDAEGPALGLINLPALGELVAAGRGLGCYCNGARARVSGRSEVRGSYLTTSGFDYWPDEPLMRVKRAGFQMRTWGDGYGYVLVATGRVDAMVDPAAADYDLAAPQVIIPEAGGRFSDWSGADSITTGNGVATNGALHDQVLGLLSG
jgi:histidinol phosphatase-like enzyme (inositol monophosphatase family)